MTSVDGGSARPLILESDRFESDERFMLHLSEVVRNALGDRAGTAIDPKLQLVEGKTVCLVSCRRSPDPVFLAWKNTHSEPDGDLFVCSGPVTVRSDQTAPRTTSGLDSPPVGRKPQRGSSSAAGRSSSRVNSFPPQLTANLTATPVDTQRTPRTPWTARAYKTEPRGLPGRPRTPDRRTFNPSVRGSNPRGPTSLTRSLEIMGQRRSDCLLEHSGQTADIVVWRPARFSTPVVNARSRTPSSTFWRAWGKTPSETGSRVGAWL